MPRPLVWFLPLQVVLALGLWLVLRFNESFGEFVSVALWLAFHFSPVTIAVAWSVFATRHWSLRMTALVFGWGACCAAVYVMFDESPSHSPWREVAFLAETYVVGGWLAVCPWRLAGFRWINLTTPCESPAARFQVSIAMLFRWTALCAAVIYLTRLTFPSATIHSPIWIITGAFFISAAFFATALTVALSANRHLKLLGCLIPMSLVLIVFAIVRSMGASDQEAFEISTRYNPLLYVSLWLLVWIVVLRKSGYRIRREQPTEAAGTSIQPAENVG